jgi:GT2 family glycosyltransferase
MGSRATRRRRTLASPGCGASARPLQGDDQRRRQPDDRAQRTEQNGRGQDAHALNQEYDPATDSYEYRGNPRESFPYSIACGKPMDFSYYHTGNVSTSRKQLCEVEGFNEEFFVYGMEDIELGYRLEQNGWLFLSNTNAFLGINVVEGGYTWSAGGPSTNWQDERIILNDQWSPIIFQSP